jgi:hypothetical protein
MKLKGYLQVSTGHLYNVLEQIDIPITNGCQQFSADLSKCHVKHYCSHKCIGELQDLFYEISPCALELLAQQIKLAKDPTCNQPCSSSFSHNSASLVHILSLQGFIQLKGSSRSSHAK